MSLVIRNARVLTLAGDRPRRGRALGDLGVLERADVALEGDRIREVSRGIPAPGVPGAREMDAAGRVLMPAFVDCHTHACWAGSRVDEWDRKLQGVTYLELLRAGGGIMSTVRAVRAAGEAELAGLLGSRLTQMARAGTLAAEVKSGYGLTLEHELKMLRVIRSVLTSPPPHLFPSSVVPTALLGHALDPDTPGFVDRTINETLPAVSREFPGITLDAFCEQSAWSLADTVRLLSSARELGHPVRVHADQFNSLGMIPEAIRLNARSVDHLEASTPADIDLLAASNTFGVILPACGFHLDGRYAGARRFVDAGGLLALATNFNPGSAPTPSVPMAIALAVRHCGLSPAEAISAATLNAAALLGLHDRGQISPGQRADLILLRHTDERMLAYEFGADPIDAVIRSGTVINGA
ncbi:MAG: imidazolonepropionase [Phycisphaerales bacterium]